jgi:Glycosyl hydrolases family 2, sugar binding domain/Glycosyl hydrolases family 2, TIM barrel domain/Glycosyl hydrolases family 2
MTCNSNITEQQYFRRDFAPQEGLIKEIQKPYRDEICLNGYWQFMCLPTPEKILEEVDMPKELPKKEIWDETPIKIPSPWNVNNFTDGKGGDFRNFPSYPEKWEEIKCAWLKKTILIPNDWEDHRIHLHFEAVAGFTRVFVNGTSIGDNFETFLPFTLDISEHVKAGEETSITIWVADGCLFDKPGKYGIREYVGGSFWGSFVRGIWQDVYLHKLPNIFIEDVFVQPFVEKDELNLAITVKNTTSKPIEAFLKGDIKCWCNQTGESMLEIPEVKWTLGDKMLDVPEKKINVNPHESIVVEIQIKVNDQLSKWSPESPTLYGSTLDLIGNNLSQDRHYVRFGWREFKIQGKKFYLNGKHIQLKGDSWHFMGVPQMTRRYAYAWYKMLKDANANAVRLHAQVFPRVYLEMADEMGMCVLDESAIWFSDGKSRVDSEKFWQACRSHVERMVLRDRNYPSVFGWSVSNETLMGIIAIFHAKPSLIKRDVKEINKWVEIAQKNDPTRDWISGDGEMFPNTQLPTRIVHYGPKKIGRSISLLKKPWGVGETGKAYFGTPKQVSEFNGDRAFESQLGRMEGLAKEGFDLLKNQRICNASYCSIFNIVWYGLKPLALGLKDIQRAPILDDGIFFNTYIEAQPGYQPERLGPYCTTLNPGYDADLDLYEPWPLFDAVKAAYADDYMSKKNPWEKKINNIVNVKRAPIKDSIVWLSSGEISITKSQFEVIGANFELLNANRKQLIIIDGQYPPMDDEVISTLKKSMNSGSTILIWRATEPSCEIIEYLTGESATLYEREATSYIIKDDHSILRRERNKTYYFSEIAEKPVSTHSLGGQWLEKSTLLLEACNTDWNRWNYQSEATKTANVYRSEREEKNPGDVIVQKSFGAGELIVSTLDLFSLTGVGGKKVHNILRNLGAPVKFGYKNRSKALGFRKLLKNAMYSSCNSPKEFNASATNQISANIFGKLNLTPSGTMSKTSKYHTISFWIYSPRSLTDLLIEPGVPRLGMKIKGKNVRLLHIDNVNVEDFKPDVNKKSYKLKAVPFEKGWNHIVLYIENKGASPSKLKIQFRSNKFSYLRKMKSITQRN